MKKLFKKSNGIFLVLNIIVSIVAIGFLMGVSIELMEAPMDTLEGDHQVALGTKQMEVVPKIPTQTRGQVSDLELNDPLTDNFEGGSATEGFGSEGAGTEKTGQKKDGGIFSKLFKGPVGGTAQSLMFAATAYGVGGFIGNMIGLEESGTEALQYAAAGGAFSYKFLTHEALGGEWFSSLTQGQAFGISLGISAVIFVLTYKKTKYERVEFSCEPWEAPIGGENCNECNEDPMHECTEYRCKSLGQGCVYKEEEGEGFCYWKDEAQVNSPSIIPWENVLTNNYDYTNTKPRPPSWGTEIVNTESGFGSSSDCIEPFTPIEFGIQTDIISQCKISYDETERNFESIDYYMGDSSAFKYNHSQLLSLPNQESLEDYANKSENAELEINNGGEYEFYITCKSANGYYNEEPYAIKFCVKSGPDTTPPRIEEESIQSGSYVQHGVDSVPVSFYTNEPANCRWSKTDLVYGEMENSMECRNDMANMNSDMLYECKTELTSVKDEQINKYYVRCEDQPWADKGDRMQMTTSHEYVLEGTQPLNIKEGSLFPKNGETVSGTTSVVDVEIGLETRNGADNQGTAECYFSIDNESYNKFLETGSHKHKQTQGLGEGTHNYYIKCIDSGGNQDTTSTTFNVYVDDDAPQVVRVLHESNQLELITDEDSDCYYTSNDNTKCDYDLGNDSIANAMIHKPSDDLRRHFGEWDTDKNYYIKCVDFSEPGTAGNKPAPTECSIIVKPTDIQE